MDQPTAPGTPLRALKATTAPIRCGDHNGGSARELHRVRAPTLVIGGTADPYYSPDLFRRTAAGIPGGHAVIVPSKGHLYAAASRAAANIALGFLLAG